MEDNKEKIYKMYVEEGFSKTEIQKEFSLTAFKLNKILSEILPKDFENPRELIVKRFGAEDERQLAMSIAKKLYKQFPNLDFWRKVSFQNLKSIRQLSTSYALKELIPLKYRDFNIVIPENTKKIHLSKEKIGEDYEIKPKLNTKNLLYKKYESSDL